MTNSDGDTKPGRGGSGAASAFSIGSLVAGRYKIVRVVGSGSSGDVYEALDTALGGQVAVKALKPSVAGNAVQLERFRREIQNARKVTHANVCRIFDMGMEGAGTQQRFFLTMELLAGQSLAQRLADGAPYTLGDALPVATEIASGLQAAHDAGIVHRDLKPGNIMLLGATGQGPARTVITDFGIAVSDEQSDIRLTESGELIGTPDYMAPEQADLGPAIPATDIYAFGLIVYEMLTKRRPFDSAATPLATVLQRRHDPPRPLGRILPGVDARWEATIHRCLERDPARRFQRAADVIAAFRGEMSPTPAAAGALGRFAKKLTRR